MTNQLTVTAPEGLPLTEFTREFDAPVEAVFEAFRDPALVRQWLGPHGYDMDLETYDFRTGGRYRYRHRTPDGAEYAFRGVFHTVRDNEFAVQTFEFEGVPDVVSLDRMTFVRLDGGRTRLEGHSMFPSVEARDVMVASGMADGMSQGYDRLDTVVSSVTA